MMTEDLDEICYAIAAPDQGAWERQFSKVPAVIKKRLNLRCLLVRESGVRDV